MSSSELLDMLRVGCTGTMEAYTQLVFSQLVFKISSRNVIGQ